MSNTCMKTGLSFLDVSFGTILSSGKMKAAWKLHYFFRILVVC